MKQKKWPLFLLALLLAASILGSVLVLRRPDTSMVEVVRDGQVLYQFDLAQEADRVLEIEYEGRVNTIEIKDHQIHMRAAECPDNTCVHMGWLDSTAPIVCLPNHLVIQFAENHEALDGIAR